MTKKSLGITLTPLIVAILALIEAYVNDGSLSTEKLVVVISAFATFIASGAIGAKVSVSKKALK